VLGDYHPETAKAYGNLATIYKSKGDYNTALKYHLKALEGAEKGKNKHQIATSHYHLADIYRNLKNFDKAFYHFEEAYRLNKELNVKKKKLKDTLVKFLKLIENSKDTDKKIYYFEELYKLNKELKVNRKYLKNTLRKLISFLSEKGDMEKLSFYKTELKKLNRDN